MVPVQHMPPRISMFTASLIGGGGRRALLTLSARFAEEGYPVDLVVGRKGGDFVSQVHPDVSVYDLKAARTMYCLPGLVRYLRRVRPTAMLTDDGGTNLMALWARRLAGVPTHIIIGARLIHAWEYSYYPYFKNKLARYMYRMFYSWADAIVAVSQEAAKDTALISNVPLEHIHVIYNPIVTPRLLAQAQAPVANPWLAPGAPPVILGVGRLTHVKGFDTLIRAFAHIRQRRLARLLILGEGPERPHLMALAHQLGVQADIALPGFEQNPYAYMNRAAVFVLSSLSEAMSNVLIEAMALGTPVIATACPGGTREALRDGKYGRIVPVGNVEAMAEAICATLDTPLTTAEALRQRADAFSLETSFQQYKTVLLDSY